MRGALPRTLLSLATLLLALGLVILIARHWAELGDQPLLLRALAVNLPILLILLALYPWLPPFRDRPLSFLAAAVVPALLPALIWFLLVLPRSAGEGLVAEQLDASLITDRSSNGIVEVGFAYPIFTPRVRVRNREAFTRRVHVFFRLRDAQGESALFRGVRAEVPAAGLSVEATIQGMLSENADYLFNPLVLAPGQELAGRPVFIVTSIEDGRSFSDTFRLAQSAQLELRDPETGTLLLEMPISGL